MGDRAFIYALRDGRQPTYATMNKVDGYIRAKTQKQLKRLQTFVEKYL